MKFTLKEYQSSASQRILKQLQRGREDWRAHQERTAFALSSTTGSGKTVIAATVIEALLHGSDEFDFDPDPTAVVLWVSKDPSLNEQTRSRFIECADRIPPGDLILLDKSFAEESLQTGLVYFINPAKLSKRAEFVKHTDTRAVTFWEILQNTINDNTKTLYMVLDEAHEGMQAPSDADQTIVQRIIRGDADHHAMPIVWGISATVQRFDSAMSQAANFVKRPNIVIDPKDVQQSGLLKHTLTLDIPDEAGDFVTTMIRDATLDFVDVCKQWDEYCEREHIETKVAPLMVIQIPNRAEGSANTAKGRTEEDKIIHLVLETVRKHWIEMPEQCVAHVLGDRGPIEVGSYEIRRIAPQDVQSSQDVRILVAKDAISTGWDCPRAEVLVSLRPGADHTYVTQLLGRMVRTPLAQTTSEERLNSTSCYLPKFNRDTARAVAEEIMGMREPSSGPAGPAIAKVLLKPVTLTWNAAIPEDVRGILEALPSFEKPTSAPRPVKRLLKAAQALSQDAIVANANRVAHDTLFDVLDGLRQDHKSALAKEAKQILTADIRQVVAVRGQSSSTTHTTQRDADIATIDDALRHLRRLITTSVVNGYLSRAAGSLAGPGQAPSQDDIAGLRADVAALALIDADVQAAVEDAADSLTKLWLTKHAHEIRALPDSRQPTYDAIRSLARSPERAAIEIKTVEQVDTVDTAHTQLPVAERHVLSDGGGDYPLEARLNNWERATIRRESADALAWYRNPSSASKHSLRIAYEDGDSWKSLQPDFIIVSSDRKASIVDPHGAHL